MTSQPASRRIWIPSADVDDRAMLMVELPAGMERPSKAEHYDFMESKVIGLLAKNSDEGKAVRPSVSRALRPHLSVGRNP